MTVVEGQVPPGRWAALEQAYQRIAEHLPPQMVETYLVRGTSDPALCRIVSVWHSHEALEEMRRSAETPGALLVFREVGVEPALAIFDVVGHRAPLPHSDLP